VKQNYAGSVATYNTWPGNKTGLFYNATDPDKQGSEQHDYTNNKL